MADAILPRARLAELRLAGLKRCYACDLSKPFEAFSRDKSRSDGMQPRCKACYTAYKTARNPPKPRVTAEEKRARRKAAAMEYRSKNLEAVRQSSKDWNANNIVKFAAYQNQWRKENAVKVLETRRRYKLANAKSIAIKNKAYSLANKAASLAHVRRRQAHKLKATPVWADEVKMRQIYLDARSMMDSSGGVFHVDHIVPLRSPLVCGLHCEANLQVITQVENLRKGNRHWPDMP